jgi:hypothetical protein
MKIFVILVAWITLSISLIVPYYSTAFHVSGIVTRAFSTSCKWIPESRREHPINTRSLLKTVLRALSERQMQFWEDVEKGMASNLLYIFLL